MVLLVCSSSLFLVGLDTTIVNVALPSIGDGLAIDTRALEWVVDAYTIVFASLLITSGALADRFGRRRVFVTGLIGFGVTSLLCAVAPTAGVLIAARVLQGVAASMLSPVALAIVVAAMPDPRERARAIGVWASVFGLSMAAGPVLGGALLSVFDWRSVFWINVPLVLIALVAVVIVVPESHGSRTRRLDLLGQLLLVVLLVLVVGGLIEGPHAGWSSPVMLAIYGALAVVAPVFIRVEARRKAPLIDLAAFRHPAFTAAVLGAIAVFVAISVTLLFNTFYLQGARGWTPLATGFAVLPIAVGATVCAPLSGSLVARVGPRPPLIIAGCFLATGGLLAWVATAGSSSSDAAVVLLVAAYALFGIGVGFANAPITNTAVGGLPAERAGVAGGITSTARQVGAAVGIAVAGGLLSTVFSSGSDVRLVDLAGALTPGWIIVVTAGTGLIILATATGGSARSVRVSTSGRPAPR
ncbi:MFS transporter [Rhodococcus sp. PSBB049]|uniref:MFS transporter n=1 Tax=Rhodococcus sp. PSBB049 TaxID=2812863 RepID=UPI001982450A|nr:MFS transporter [Rhodococcus sp. PSBB049]QSE72536.1 MFS transporter [Rhodococcus sp. PSBB049]